MVGAGDVTARGAIEVGERRWGFSRKPTEQVLRAWYGAMRLFTRGRQWERGGRPTLLSPAEQVFEAVQRWVEGRRYERIEAKKAAVEAVPRRWEAEAKVSSLLGWHYIRQALNALPS
jgi:hypothetical protein